MKLHFLDPAKIEFKETVIYYNSQCEGLGREFNLAVKDALNRINQYPEAWVTLSRRTRRCQVKRFPYGVIYQITHDSIMIVAIQHLHRDPDSWKHRLRE